MKAFQNNLKQGNAADEFVEIFNNVETMRTYYPETYKAYHNTIAGHTDPTSELREEYVDIEIVHIGYANKNKKAIVIDVAGNASVTDGYSILKPTIRNRAGQKIEFIATDNFLGNSQYASIYVPLPQAGEPSLDLDLITFAYTVDSQVTQYSCSLNLSPYLLDFVSEFTIEHPRIQRTAVNSDLMLTDINICYFYKLDGTDYFYSSKDLIDGNLRIPNKGRIKLDGIHITSIQNVSLSVENSAHTKRYHTSAGNGVTLLDSQTIAWDISANWGFPYRTLLADIYEYMTYTLTITANCQGQLAVFVVTNQEDSVNAINKKQIEKINIYRDCFTEGTELLLSDHTKKQVEQLKTGDCLKSQNGSIAEISQIAVQTSPQMLVHIQMEDGREIFLTEGHPVVTDQGLRCAVRLENGDTLLTIDGAYKIKQVCAYPEEKVTCYSLILTDSSQRIYANGFLTTDAVAELSEKELSEKYQIAEKWRADYDGWMARNRGEHA